VAATISAILVAAAITLIAPVVRSNSYTSRLQVGSSLGQELLENVRTTAANSWNAIYSRATSSANAFYIDTRTNPFSVASGVQTSTVNGVQYTRYFYIDEVYRTAEVDGNITTSTVGTYLDPSMRKITVVYRWPGSSTNTLSYYVARSNNQTYLQSNWTEGSTSTIVSTTFSGFTTSSNINYSSSSGSILIDL